MNKDRVRNCIETIDKRNRLWILRMQKPIKPLNLLWIFTKTTCNSFRSTLSPKIVVLSWNVNDRHQDITIIRIYWSLSSKWSTFRRFAPAILRTYVYMFRTTHCGLIVGKEIGDNNCYHHKFVLTTNGGDNLVVAPNRLLSKKFLVIT